MDGHPMEGNDNAHNRRLIVGLMTGGGFVRDDSSIRSHKVV
jgi:hypothetical protein